MVRRDTLINIAKSSSNPVKKTAKTPEIINPAEKTPQKTKNPPKQTSVQPSKLGLPQGSVYQETGRRRPLIVFPK